MAIEESRLNIVVDPTGAEKGSRKAGRALQGLDKQSKKTSKSVDGLSSTIRRLVAALAAYKVGQFVKNTAMLGARFDTLGVVMEQVGKNAGYSRKEMDKYDAQLRKTGISMIESRSNLIKMTQAQLDLSKSSKLARIAQDAAVIGNINSSEAFARMIHGIQAGQTEVLRTIGINVTFEEGYKKLAKQLGIQVSQLTATEKAQARANQVMSYGPRIAGAYEAAMGTAGKKISSFARYVEDFKVKMGLAFGPATVVIIDKFTEVMKQWQKDIEKPETQKALKDLANLLATQVSYFADLANNIPKVVSSYQDLEFTVKKVKEVYDSLDKSFLGQILKTGYQVSGIGLLVEYNKKLYEWIHKARLEAELYQKAAIVTPKQYSDQEAQDLLLEEQIAGKKFPVISPTKTKIKKELAPTVSTVERAATKATLKAAADAEFKYVSQLDEGIQGVEETIRKLTMASLPEHQAKVLEVTEKYAQWDKEIQNLRLSNDITFEKAKELSTGLSKRMAEDMKNIREEGQETFGDSLKNAVTGWASNFSSTLNDLVWDADVSFKAILRSFGQMITQMLIQKQLVEPLLRGMGLGSESAKGNVFTNGRIEKYANGGLITGPTSFRTSDGKNNIAGEAGTEAIMPLKRLANGRLGVEASGGAGNRPMVEVTVINNSKEKASIERRQDGNGKLNIRVLVGEAMAADFMGQGPGAQAMNTVYGTQPKVFG